jgi:multidrug efflux pump subunit AcrA (membrane-fusion protein)
MNKHKLVEAFIQQLETDLQAMKAAAQANVEAATHEESRAENEYDTRGLEASYLAGAQAKRAAEIDETLAQFRNLDIKTFAKKDPIQSTALIKVKMHEKPSWLFLMPQGGGLKLKFEGESVQVVTPQSHLGQALLRLKVGEVAEFEVGGQMRTADILEVL